LCHESAKLRARQGCGWNAAVRGEWRAKAATSFEMSKYTAFRCPEDLLELAKVKAKKDRRSLSNYIITLIEKDVQDMMPESESNDSISLPKRK
jgi:hypothetical protein